jgi:phosphoserine aminotransferase
MLNFYPGPSKLHPNTKLFYAEGISSGLFERNHRSLPFMELYDKLVQELRKKLNIPTDYHIAFTSSATECWEIFAQSIIDEKCLHYYNGAFGEKWHSYSQALGKKTVAQPFTLEENPAFPPQLQDCDTIALCHTETSNGTAIPHSFLQELREQYPAKIIGVDATSSMGGIALPWELGDFWFSSVQKCFGLPPGLAVLVFSPAAIKRAEKVAEISHYNSLLNISEHSKNHQTTHTPNTPAFYLLFRVMQGRQVITQEEKTICHRHDHYISKLRTLGYDINGSITKSAKTVLCISPPSPIPSLLAEAESQHIILGKGYGPWKDTTFRIANFPNHTDEDMKTLLTFLKSYS